MMQLRSFVILYIAFDDIKLINFDHVKSDMLRNL